jgi:hypothetical protein
MSTNADNFHSYMRGWTAGAKCGVVDPAFENHEDRNIRDYYMLGYTDGRHARKKAGTKLSGYVPSILRAMGDESD